KRAGTAARKVARRRVKRAGTTSRKVAHPLEKRGTLFASSRDAAVNAVEVEQQLRLGHPEPVEGSREYEVFRLLATRRNAAQETLEIAKGPRLARNPQGTPRPLRNLPQVQETRADDALAV